MVSFFLMTCASALLLAASFPPWNTSAFAWFCLAPFFYALRKSSITTAALYGYLFGYLFGACTFFWVNSIAVVSAKNFLFVILIFSLYFVIFGILYRFLCKTSRRLIIISAPSLWVSLEFIRSNLFFLSWPWNLLGYTQHNVLSVIQIADITGVYGVSFLIAMTNQLLSDLPELVAKQRSGKDSTDLNATKRTVLISAAVVMLLCAGILVYGEQKLLAPKSNSLIRVALIQANILAEDNMNFREQITHLGRYKKLTLGAAHENPDLIIWPASSLPGPISSRLVNFTVRRIAFEADTYLLAGGAANEKLQPAKEGYNGYSNSEFLVSPEGSIEGQYNKIRLLPFNEYLPMQGKMRWPRWITTLQTGFVPGDTFTLFEVSGARFGTPICWENMFPELFRHFVRKGAQFMVSVTNEGFFTDTSGHYQSLAMNVFRAVENRVEIARSNTTGVSCFISRNGEVTERISDENGKDVFVSGYAVRNMYLSDSKTFYTQHGDVFAYVTIACTVFFVLISLLLIRRGTVNRDKT